MTLNLSARLRDAVDGPGHGLDAVVGEDPAGFDLATLSTRIRRRRRARVTVLSAVGVTTAGAVALSGSLVVGSRGADDRPAEPAAAVALPPIGRQLCGHDPAELAGVDTTSRLAPGTTTLSDDGNGNLVVGAGGDDLGEIAGRRLAASVVSSEPSGMAAGSLVVLTSAGTVVAVGELEPEGSGGETFFESSAATVEPVTADLAPCPTAQGTTPDRVPSGAYSVVYLVPATDGGGAQGLVRAEPDGLSVTLLDLPAPVTGLPDAYPADEVPVVGGTLLGVHEGGVLAHDGWQVQVAVAGDDGLTRVAQALRAAAAEWVTLSNQTIESWPEPTEVVGSSPVVDPVELAALQERLTQARDAAADALAAVAAVQADAEADRADLERTLAEADTARQRLEEASAALTQATANETLAEVTVLTVVTSFQVTATTESWDVTVTSRESGGLTILTYQLTRR